MMYKHVCKLIEYDLKKAKVKIERFQKEIYAMEYGEGVSDFFEASTPKELIETIIGLKKHELELLQEYADTLNAELTMARG